MLQGTDGRHVHFQRSGQLLEGSFWFRLGACCSLQDDGRIGDSFFSICIDGGGFVWRVPDFPQCSFDPCCRVIVREEPLCLAI